MYFFNSSSCALEMTEKLWGKYTTYDLGVKSLLKLRAGVVEMIADETHRDVLEASLQQLELLSPPSGGLVNTSSCICDLNATKT